MSHSSSTSGSSISSLPPAYIPPPTDATARLPSYSSPSSSIRRNEATDVDSLADHLLPTYSEISQTEPWCLPRTLFFFGLIPFLGVFFAGLGAWVRWIDLDVGALNEGCHEELGEGIVEGQGRRAPQNGTEDRLREEVLKREKVVILRKVSIRFARGSSLHRWLNHPLFSFALAGRNQMVNLLHLRARRTNDPRRRDRCHGDCAAFQKGLSDVQAGGKDRGDRKTKTKGHLTGYLFWEGCGKNTGLRALRIQFVTIWSLSSLLSV